MNYFKAAMLLYQSPPECKNLVHLKKTQFFYFVMELTKPFAVPKACTRKLREILVSYFFVLIITLLLRIFGEALMSISNKHNYATFTKSPPASLLHRIKNSHSSGKCCDLLKMAALSFTKSHGPCTIFIH